MTAHKPVTVESDNTRLLSGIDTRIISCTEMSPGHSSDLLEICSFHPEALACNKKSEFEFFAFNLSTGATLPVSVHGDNVLCLCISDIHFAAHGGPAEAKVVSQLRDIIDPPADTHAATSACGTRFRGCLRSLLSLYSTCVEDGGTDAQELHGTGTLQHEISFIELTFSIKHAPELTNNFAALVPISCKNGVVSALLPFNGCLWEEKMGQQARCFIQSPVIPGTPECDERVTRLRIMFRDRRLMMSGKQLVAPFVNIENNRERRKNFDPKHIMYLRQNTETYLMMYGTLVSIGRSHQLMTEHEMCMSIVQNVVLTAVRMFGFATRISSHDLINNFFTILCYCMHLGQLGLKSYRLDVVGEDIRKRCDTRASE